MLTLLVIFGICLLALVLIGIGYALLAISPILLCIIALPLLDFAVYKIWKYCRKKKEE